MEYLSILSNSSSPLRAPVSFVIPRKYYQEVGPDKFALNPVGTGPYKLTAIKKGDYIKFAAHDAYWGGRPPAKTITLRLVPELAGRIAGLVSGEFHLIEGVAPDLVDTLFEHVHQTCPDHLVLTV